MHSEKHIKTNTFTETSFRIAFSSSSKSSAVVAALPRRPPLPEAAADEDDDDVEEDNPFTEPKWENISLCDSKNFNLKIRQVMIKLDKT